MFRCKYCTEWIYKSFFVIDFHGNGIPHSGRELYILYNVLIHKIVIILYVLNIGLILVLLYCCIKRVSGVWPPKTRRMFVFGWTWYILIYVLAARLYVSILLKNGINLADPLLYVGLIIVLVGVFLSLWAFKAFKYAGRILGRRIDELVTWGPYRYMRNPQYVAVILILTGTTIMHRSVFILIFTILQIITFYLLVLLEERELESIFKDKYLEYKKRVPRFLPRFLRISSLTTMGKK